MIMKVPDLFRQICSKKKGSTTSQAQVVKEPRHNNINLRESETESIPLDFKTDVTCTTKQTECRASIGDNLPPSSKVEDIPLTQIVFDNSPSKHNANGIESTTGRCPYMHGTVYASPYPGYIHGNAKRGICPNGCRAEMDQAIFAGENTVQTLLREATEYIELYYHERSEDMIGTEGFLPKDLRLAQISKAIHETGTYIHTFDELEHGARVAWRNAPKCSNRKYWQQLKLLDCRDVCTNQGMFDSCIRHLSKAVLCGSAEAYVTVFRPAHPGENDGPAIWNDQLLSYASYNHDGQFIGDPKNLRFTQMLEERFHWNGPPDGKRGKHDYLPLVIQSSPTVEPQLFEVPLECAPAVHIHHPDYPELSELDMAWYPIPAVCALDLSVGGILYTAAPFNGWYANTEVLRDLTDVNRYNMLVPVARALGLDPDTKPGDEPFWKDEVLTVLNKAIYHSFKAAKYAMVGHHNLIEMFWSWYKDEKRIRKYCPVNYKWIIPPMSSSTNDAYLGLNKAQEYTLKPAYLYGKNFLVLEQGCFDKRDTSKSMRMFFSTVYLALFFKGWINRTRQKRQPVLILYSSVTGNAAAYASRLGSILRACSQVNFFDCCGVNAIYDTLVFSLIQSATLCIFITSTQGNGELPSLSRKFFTILFDKKGHLLSNKRCAVLGFGSSAYPIFNGGAKELSRKISEKGGREIIHSGLCDALKGEESIFKSWTAVLLKEMASSPGASPLVMQLSEKINNLNEIDSRGQAILSSVSIQYFSSKEVKEAAADSFMSRSLDVSRRSSPLDISMRANCLEASKRSNPSPLDTSNTRFNSSESGLNLHQEKIKEAIKYSLLSKSLQRENVIKAHVLSRDDLFEQRKDKEDGCSDNQQQTIRQTSLIKIDLSLVGNPPYLAGDHLQVFPQNTISNEKLKTFIGHLDGDFNLDDHMYVTLEDSRVKLQELAVRAPLLHRNINQLVSVQFLFKTQASIESPVSTQSCLELSSLATSSKDSALLKELGTSKTEYEKMLSLTGMKWLDIFEIFPSLKGRVSMLYLLSAMKLNHPRSYSIASCKSTVGAEVDLVVGRFIFSRGGSKKEVGVCSNFLTNVNEGDEICFKIESNPSFHYPLNTSSPLIFICTGTGFAPIRGLLQKRAYLKSRGEKLREAYLVFGNRSVKESLFGEEIDEFINKGVLTDVYRCYSREPGMKKQYTTDLLKTEAVEEILTPIVEDKHSHIFVCGAASMAQTCKSIFVDMTSKFHVNKLIEEGRLHFDVFGSLGQSEYTKRRTSEHTHESKKESRRRLYQRSASAYSLVRRSGRSGFGSSLKGSFSKNRR